MAKDFSWAQAIQSKYSFPRLQWLIGIISVTSLLYISSEELWRRLGGMPFPQTSCVGLLLYFSFFCGLLFISHFYDSKRLAINTAPAVAITIFSIAFDVLVISTTEFITLIMIGVFPQDYIAGVALLLVGALPASLGSVTLSSLTAETLRKRARKLYDEVKHISQQIEELEKQREMATKRQEDFEKLKKSVFKEHEKTE